MFQGSWKIFQESFKTVLSEFNRKKFQKCLKNISMRVCFVILLLHGSHRSYPSRRRPCYFGSKNFLDPKIFEAKFCLDSTFCQNQKKLGQEWCCQSLTIGLPYDGTYVESERLVIAKQIGVSVVLMAFWTFSLFLFLVEK